VLTVATGDSTIIPVNRRQQIVNRASGQHVYLPGRKVRIANCDAAMNTIHYYCSAALHCEFCLYPDHL